MKKIVAWWKRLSIVSKICVIAEFVCLFFNILALVNVRSAQCVSNLIITVVMTVFVCAIAGTWTKDGM